MAPVEAAPAAELPAAWESDPVPAIPVAATEPVSSAGKWETPQAPTPSKSDVAAAQAVAAAVPAAPAPSAEAPRPAPAQPIISDVVPAPHAAVADAIEAVNSVQVDASEAVPEPASAPVLRAVPETPAPDSAKQSGA
jgi:hypothetical protein